jgi:hypothetical protein
MKHYIQIFRPELMQWSNLEFSTSLVHAWARLDELEENNPTMKFRVHNVQ